MTKRIKVLIGGALALFSLIGITACNNNSNNTNSGAGGTTGGNQVTEEGTYQVKQVDFYRVNTKVDRQVPLRFYSEAPNVPYVGVKQFFKEFYKTDVVVEQNGDNFKFKRDYAYIKVDTKDEIFTILGIDLLGVHPDFKSTTSTIFLKSDSTKNTTSFPKTIDLTSYSINTYKGDGDAYVPFSLLSNIVTSTALFFVVYNEKALFEFDYQGDLPEGKRMETYYGDLIKAPMKENTKRQKDMISFNYNLICLLIDNFRGYTSQMKFIDNNVLSLGLNGTLEEYYPAVKQLLLSEDRKEYIAGTTYLFFGLDDGGHTGLMTNLANEIYTEEKPITSYVDEDSPILSLTWKVTLGQTAEQYAKANMINLKKQIFGIDDTKFYYKFDSAKKMSYLGFDQFEVNYEGWDSYYKAVKAGQTGQIPQDDTYAYIRGKLYQALDDGAETVILDLSTNGGGDSNALVGIVGLLNRAKGTISFNDIANHYRTTEYSSVDINLDGKYDDKDEAEAIKFADMNIVLLTSSTAFSCGNLLPSLLKELGYKTIGEQTGGGSCAIMLGAFADGPSYVRSSYKCLSDAAGNNIDSGVPVDVDLTKPGQKPEGRQLPIVVKDYSNFYDIEYVYNVIQELFN